jgi:AcrR family transcriptional regulator
MARNAENSRLAILAAAERLLRRRGTTETTIEAVAKETRCAKGLVHYHFKTKPALLGSVAEQMGAAREAAWVAAFRAPSPEAAIQQTWDLVTREARDGTIRAWTSLLSERNSLTVQTVRHRIDTFATALSGAVSRLLQDLGLRPTIPVREMGWLLAGVVHGMGIQLDAGANPAELQGAYAAAWLGVLSLAKP